MVIYNKRRPSPDYLGRTVFGAALFLASIWGTFIAVISLAPSVLVAPAVITGAVGCVAGFGIFFHNLDELA